MKKIVQGEKKVFTINLTEIDENDVSTKFDLTGNEEITVCFNVRSTTVVKNRVAATIGVVVVGAETDGKIQATLLVADTKLLDTGKGDVEIVVTKPSNDISIFQQENGFEIFPSKCP